MRRNRCQKVAHEGKSHCYISFLKTVCGIMATATHPGAQTERRGGAGPVRGLLGGKDLTGRFSSSTARAFGSLVAAAIKNHRRHRPRRRLA
jgi:hypothetical protein